MALVSNWPLDRSSNQLKSNQLESTFQIRLYINDTFKFQVVVSQVQVSNQRWIKGDYRFLLQRHVAQTLFNSLFFFPVSYPFFFYGWLFLWRRLFSALITVTVQFMPDSPQQIWIGCLFWPIIEINPTWTSISSQLINIFNFKLGYDLQLQDSR